MINRNKKIIFSILLILILNLNLVSGASIAINPGSLRVNNMVRNGYAERTVRVSTNEETAIVRIAFENRNNEVNDWVTLDPNDEEFIIGRDNPRDIKVSVEPPEDTPNGNYSTSIIFMLRGDAELEGLTGAVIDTAVSFRVVVTVVDDEVVSCNIVSENIRNIELGDQINPILRVHNTGNIRLNPTVEIQIWNQDQSRLERTIISDSDMILPTIIDEISILENTRGLMPGQYFADIKVPECRYEESLTFDILEPGTISADGELIGIRVSAWNNKSDEIIINPIFENKGERNVEAFFEGVIRKDGNIRARLNTPRIIVEPGQRFEFETFFSSDDPGRYEVSGRVYYENKRTFEKVNRFNILDQYSESKESSMEFTTIGSSIIVLTIISLVLLILIKKKKQKLRKRRRHRN